MNIELIFGIFFLVMGFIGLIGYITKNEKMFTKKDRIKNVYGEKGGEIFHFIKYVASPIIIGIVMLLAELN